MIASADFFTMAAIALTRCLGIVFSQSKLIRITGIFCPKVTGICCLLIWVVAFIILSPTTFGQEGFGTFGYDPQHAKCEIKDQKELVGVGISPAGLYYLGGNTVPCLIINASYIVLGFYIKAQTRRLASRMPNDISKVCDINCYAQLLVLLIFFQMESRNTNINVTLLTLTLAYFLFTFPEVPLEFGLLDAYLEEDQAAFVSLCISSWYWWVYASNLLIYVATTRDFRTIYRVFLADMSIKCGAHSLAAKILPPKDRQALA